jgi:hypothetical protein
VVLFCFVWCFRAWLLAVLTVLSVCLVLLWVCPCVCPCVLCVPMCVLRVPMCGFVLLAAAGAPVTSTRDGSASSSAGPSTSSIIGRDRVIVLHAYVPRSPDELALKPGDILTVTGKEDDGWWHGLASDGSTGVFPSNFVRET